MRVLLVNKFYYNRGGDCTATLATERLLKEKGHQVAVFSMNYPQNFDSEWKEYFADEVSMSLPGVPAKINAVLRIMFGTGVEKPFMKLLKDFKPDVVHLHNIHSYLSPLLAQIAKKHGIKVVWTMHDYKLVCPSYSCFYNGKVCEDCLSCKFSVVSRKCMKDSMAASFIAWAESVVWNRRRLSSLTDEFICPSHFMADKMYVGGFPKDKLKVLCNFIDSEKSSIIRTKKVERIPGSYCYIGRLSEEKGVEMLLKVASKLDYTLYIGGSGPLEEKLKLEYSSCNNIHFLGRLDSDQVIELFSKSCFSVIPSRWYENNPISVIESLCCGTPVLGANIGGIPELLDNEECMLYKCDSEEELESCIVEMMNRACHNVGYKKLSEKSLERFSGENYYKELIQLYA